MRVEAGGHQLENACENCPPGGAPPKNKTAQDCFDLVGKAYMGMATDAVLSPVRSYSSLILDSRNTS